MNGNKTKQRRRALLMEKDPHCCYCGREVIYYELKDGEQAPDNFATIEHVNSKIDGPRPRYGERLLCCYRCNHDKGNREYQERRNRELARLDLNQEPPD